MLLPAICFTHCSSNVSIFLSSADFGDWVPFRILNASVQASSQSCSCSTLHLLLRITLFTSLGVGTFLKRVCSLLNEVTLPTTIPEIAIMYFCGYREGFSWCFLIGIFSRRIDKRVKKSICLPPFSSNSNESFVHNRIQVIGALHVENELLPIVWNFNVSHLELHGHWSPDFWKSCSSRTIHCCSLRGLLGANLAASNLFRPNAQLHLYPVFLDRNVVIVSSRASRWLCKVVDTAYCFSGIIFQFLDFNGNVMREKHTVSGSLLLVAGVSLKDDCLQS